MNQFHAGAREVCEVAYAFRIARADEDDEGRLVDDAALRACVPVRGDEAALLETFNVALDGEDGDVRADALQNLVRHRLRTGERRSEAHVLPVLLFPLRRERRIDGLLQRLLQDREAVERDLHAARLRRSFRQATAEDKERERNEKRQRAPLKSTAAEEICPLHVCHIPPLELDAPVIICLLENVCTL